VSVSDSERVVRLAVGIPKDLAATCPASRFVLTAVCIVLAGHVEGTASDSESAEAMIVEAEKLPPVDTVSAYLGHLRQRTLPAGPRGGLIAAFAKHARHLSPYYGPSTIRIAEREWIGVLSEGLHDQPTNQDIVFALMHLLINSHQYAKALDTITPHHQATPGHESMAWLEHCRTRTKRRASSRRSKLPQIDLHFCVITANPAARRKASISQLKREVAILNKTFVNLKGRRLVRFRFRSASLFSQVKDLRSPFVALGDSRVPYSSNGYAKLFNQCHHSRVRDPRAINFYGLFAVLCG
jgi:hypothetical protein